MADPDNIPRFAADRTLTRLARWLRLMGADVLCQDRLSAAETLRIAREQCRAETLNYEDADVLASLREITGGHGPDCCIDAAGMEAHTPGPLYAYDRAKQALMLESDRPFALREAIMACRNGGTVSVPGVYGGFVDKIPMGSLMNRSITVKTGQTHAHRYMKPLLQRIENGDIDPTFLVTHRMALDQAPEAFDMFLKKQDECVKVVLKPQEKGAPAHHGPSRQEAQA